MCSRIVYLIRHYNVAPRDIVVVTFTNLAAQEMIARVGKMLGEPERSKELVIGTFHSVCYRLLQKYGQRIGLQKNCSIADETDKLTIMEQVVRRTATEFPQYSQNLPSNSREMRSTIGKISSKKNSGVCSSDSIKEQPLRIIFQTYQAELREAGKLDFDDLLLECRRLLRQEPDVMANVQSVLVDEFQDSNEVQLDLIELFAHARKNITVVGDPDQSIYAFRNARPENMRILLKRYPDTSVVYLEDNYRSTQAILDNAMALIRQDADRIGADRRLISQSKNSAVLPIVTSFGSPIEEAEAVAEQIAHLKRDSECINFSDIAILARTGNECKRMEISLMAQKVPYKLVAGFKFWERKEIRALIDYIRVVCFEDDRHAISRTVNVPKRGIGEKSVQKLMDGIPRATALLARLREIADDHSLLHQYEIKGKAVATKLKSYIACIDGAREALAKENNTEGLLNAISFILQKTQLLSSFDKQDDDRTSSREANIELVREYIRSMAAPEDADMPIALHFLNSIALSPGDDNSDEDKNRVIVSTMHSAKGLEWPVVFVMNCTDEFVSRFEGQDNEERRLLFVASTRAKALLYYTYSRANLNPLLERCCRPHLVKRCKAQLPRITGSQFHAIAAFLGRPPPTFSPCASFDRTSRGFSSARDLIGAKGELGSKKVQKRAPFGRAPLPSPHSSRSSVAKSSPATTTISQAQQQRRLNSTSLNGSLPSTTGRVQSDKPLAAGPNQYEPAVNNLRPQNAPAYKPAVSTKKRLGMRRGPVTNKLPFT